MSDEKQRLAALYASKTDEELVALAQDMAELTDAARDALQAEIARRKLTPESLPAPETHVVENRPLVQVARFRDLPQALLAKGGLESAGIECFLYNDNLVRLDWFWSNLVGGVSVHVAPEDADVAREILAADPQDFQPDTDGEFKQPRCPSCGSTRVAAPEGMGVSAAILWATSLPVPIADRTWVCEQCGHVWEDTTPAQAPSAD